MNLTKPAGPDVFPVHLVGAGPGDPELLTLKAARVIADATVILVDDLVGERVLQTVLDPDKLPPRVIYVGKRAGCRSTPQSFICKLLVREARAGEKVVRLKGGDPLVFGRAGEEQTALRQAGIPVVVVNGITAGLAAANALGTGWTDRVSGAQGVLLVTGHPRPGSAGPDWHAIGAVAASGMTVVIYMGVKQAPEILKVLLTHLPGDLPAGAVQSAGTEQQRAIVLTLETLAEGLVRHAIGSPAVIVIGRILDQSAVVGLAGQAAGQARQASELKIAR